MSHKHIERDRAARDYYDNLAAEFDELDKYWSNPYDAATWDMENELVERFLGHEDLILDLGTGFYPHVESTVGKHVINVDISRGSLAVARRVYQERNPRMSYVCGTALSLPFGDRSFRAVIAGGELLNHVSLVGGVAEISRILTSGGLAILSIGMKWCFDSLYAMVDAYTGNPIGYSMTRAEAAEFMRYPRRSSEVTWEVTPDLDLRIFLYSLRDIRTALRGAGLDLVQSRTLNSVSGLIPLPFQQQDEPSKVLTLINRALLEVDGFIGRAPGIKWFAGNAYLVVQKP